MAAQVINGKKLAIEIEAEVSSKIKNLQTRPCLAVILVGEHVPSQTYIRLKSQACNRVGIDFRDIFLPENASQEEVTAKIRDLNTDTSVHAILVQLPLPKHLGTKEIVQEIAIKKDVDGINPVSGTTPASPKGIMRMLESIGFVFEGKTAVVIGRSNIVGKPVAQLLLDENCTVTTCHSKTKDLAEHTRKADLIVSAAGTPELVKKEMVKENVVVIDVGISRVGGKLVGDVAFDEVSEVASYITPVIGGVGPMTIAMLLENVVECYLKN